MLLETTLDVHKTHRESTHVGGRVSSSRCPAPQPSVLAAGRSKVRQTQEKKPFRPPTSVQCPVLERLLTRSAGKGSSVPGSQTGKEGWLWISEAGAAREAIECEVQIPVLPLTV